MRALRPQRGLRAMLASRKPASSLITLERVDFHAKSAMRPNARTNEKIAFTDESDSSEWSGKAGRSRRRRLCAASCCRAAGQTSGSRFGAYLCNALK